MKTNIGSNIDKALFAANQFDKNGGFIGFPAFIMINEVGYTNINFGIVYHHFQI
jgi:hypothetical protein